MYLLGALARRLNKLYIYYEETILVFQATDVRRRFSCK